MLNNEKDIEQFFKDRFENAEVSPSNDIWEKLEADINKRDVEGIYKTAFQNATVEPAASIWRKISSTLAWRSFLTFKFNTFNIYYASLITAIVGFTSFNFLQKQSDGDVENTTTKVIENTSQVISDSQKSKDSDISESLQSDVTKFSNETTDSDVAINANEQQKEFVEATLTSPKENDGFPKGKGKKKNNESARTVDWSFVKIVGRNSICKDISTHYAIEGLNEHADVQWRLPKGAKKIQSAGHNIALVWQESGKQTLSAEVKINNEKNILNYVVNVEAVAVPSIKGKNKVCQGMEKQLYYVDETINKEISYLWEAQKNPIDLIGNKYINIDWTKSGKDTLSVIKINNTTGCKSSATMAIVIYPQPKISFEYTPLGENQYEFAFTETQRKGYEYVWTIEGMEYNDPIVTHEASGSGSSFVTLLVTDKNGCSSKIQKEVDFNKNFLAVPSKFYPSGGNFFMPQTNANLQSYRMEIYNARNEKIWETTELSDGKPVDGWDGRYRGAPLPSGKYMWKISATFEDGTKWKGIIQPNGVCRPNGIFVLEN